MSDSRCPACAAAVRAGDPWCTLCYTDLRPRQPEPLVAAGGVVEPLERHDELTAPLQPGAPLPAPSPATAPAPVPAPAPAPVTVDPTDPLGLRPPMPRWTCPACASTPTFDELICPTCGHALLSDGEPALPSLVRGDGKNARVAIMLGGAAGLTTVLVLLFWLVGSLL